ncbi:hypothetical protein [Helicobacter cinaedi]|uniref:hypothetical protein n=1 Tax=Helicobacter cinaedi TaxID=213 RepID=UPI001E60A18E|nr:hypothetical protein [Helicobacter cinaedi]
MAILWILGEPQTLCLAPPPPLKSTKSPTSTTANTRIVDSSIAESYANSMFFVILSL